MDRIALSKFLSWVLRHSPDAIGLSLDAAGWVSIDELISCAVRSGRPFTLMMTKTKGLFERDVAERKSWTRDLNWLSKGKRWRASIQTNH